MIINLICFNKFVVSFLNSTTNRPHHAVRSFTVLNIYRYQEYFHEFNIGICFNIYATEFIEPQFTRPAGGGVYVCGFREGSLYAIDYYPDQYCHHRGKYISKVNLHENCNIQPDRVLEHMLRDCLYILWSRDDWSRRPFFTSSQWSCQLLLPVGDAIYWLSSRSFGLALLNYGSISSIGNVATLSIFLLPGRRLSDTSG